MTTLTPDGLEESILFILARFGHASWLENFLAESNICTTDEQGNTALHVAAFHGHIDLSDALISAGSAVSKKEGYDWPKNKLGQTPLYVAATKGHVKYIRHAVQEYHAKKDLLMPTAWGYRRPSFDPESTVASL